MKKILFFVLLLIFVSSGFTYAGSMNPYIAGAKTTAAVTPCTGSDSWVGPHGDATYTADSGQAGTTGWNANTTYTTPAGVSQICSIGGDFRWSANVHNCRMAVFSADGSTLICQTTEKAIPSTSYSEMLWTYGASELSGTCTVSGSTNYTIVYSCDGSKASEAQVRAKSGTSGDFKYTAADKTDDPGFTGYTLPAGTASSLKKKVYFGVQ